MKKNPNNQFDHLTFVLVGWIILGQIKVINKVIYYEKSKKKKQKKNISGEFFHVWVIWAMFFGANLAPKP